MSWDADGNWIPDDPESTQSAYQQPSTTATAEMDPEQLLRQGAYSPVSLAAINTMAGQGGRGGATIPGMASYIPNYTSYAPDASLGNQPGIPTTGAGSGSAPPTPDAGNRRLLRMRAMLGAGGAGIAGLVTGNKDPTLPSQVTKALKQVNAGGVNDPNAAYRYDLARVQTNAQLAKEMGPGYATSTPGIQKIGQTNRDINADIYARQLGQQQVGLQTINALAQPLMNRQAQNTQNLFGLTGLLGTLGYLGSQGKDSWLS